ncbi:MAG: GAF sensor signal transduction histidine kinase [Firmicutes bacterium]|nr:GAF sensor signal transduction histidine kinase [Bacillota bacterium]
MGLFKNRTIKQQITTILVLVLIGPTAAILMNILFSQQIDDLAFSQKRDELDGMLASLSDRFTSEGLNIPGNLAEQGYLEGKYREIVQPLLSESPKLKISYYIISRRINLHARTEPDGKNTISVKVTEGGPPLPRPHMAYSGRTRNVITRAMPVTYNGEPVGILSVEDILISDISRVLFVRYFSLAIIVVSLAAGTLGITFIVKNLLRQVNSINDGILKLQEDLDYRIPPIPGELGKVAQAVNHMAKELKEKKRLEDQLQRSERLAALGQLVSGIAHELRNPLSIIRATVQLMEKELNAHEGISEYTGIVKEQADRQNKIIQELLDFAKPAVPQLVPVDLNQLLDSVMTFTRAYLKDSNVVLSIEKEKELPKILADGEKIKQVILNLILNGVQAMPDGGELKIKTYSTEGKTVIEFSDTGVGIPQENLEKIFNPFFTTRDGGTGLGLAIAHQIVKMHQGTLEARSVRGKGATFTVTIPAMQSEGDANA